LIALPLDLSAERLDFGDGGGLRGLSGAELLLNRSFLRAENDGRQEREGKGQSDCDAHGKSFFNVSKVLEAVS
jgi:hypothetical protein